jgi:hypothetical protein
MEQKKKARNNAIGGANEELFETYLEQSAGKTDSAKWNRLRLMKWCQDPFAKLRAEETTTHHINEWIGRSLSQPGERTGEPISGSTVNRELDLMSAAFSGEPDSRAMDLPFVLAVPCVYLRSTKIW